jgi:hypothetical protein
VLRPLIPQAKVQFQGNGNFGIEEIAAPLPAGLANHGRQMIFAAVLCAQRLITKPFHDIAGAKELLLGQQQIDVVLGAPARVVDETGAVREALQHHGFHPRALQGSGHLAKRRLNALPAFRIPREIAIRAGPNVLGQTIALLQSQRQRELSSIGKTQNSLPIAFGKLRQQSAIGRRELQSREGRSYKRRKISQRRGQKRISVRTACVAD